MKLKLKRGTSRPGSGEAPPQRDGTVRLARAAAKPKESYPAPAGTLHRAYVGGYAPAAEDDLDGEPDALPSKGLLRLRAVRDLLRSKGGRLLVGAVLFFVLGAAAAALFGMRHWLIHDERFVIPTSADIAVSGDRHITRAEVLSVFGADVERNIFKVPLSERRADLERLPWVQHATVMRLLPNHLRVALTERTPVAFVRQGTTIGLVDATGVLLDMPEISAGEPGYSFPVLTGLSPNAPLATRAARMDVYGKFIHDINMGPDKLSEKVSEVDVSNPEDVKAVITGGGADVLVHFGDEEFLNRFRQFESHVAGWRQQYPKLSAADMRYERQVVLEMQPGSGTAAAAASTPTAPAAAAAASPVAAAPHKASTPAHASAVAVAHAGKLSPQQQAAQNQKTFRALAAARAATGGAAK